MFHCPKLERMMMTLAPLSHLDWKSCVSNGPDDSSLRVLTSFAGAAIYLGWADGGPSLSQLGMSSPILPLLTCRWKSQSLSRCRLISISNFWLIYRYKILPCVLWCKMTRQKSCTSKFCVSKFTGTKFCLLFLVFYEAKFCTCKCFVQFVQYLQVQNFASFWPCFTRQNFVPVNFGAVLLAIIFAPDSEADAGV